MMDLETLRNYCLSKPGTSEGLPFDNDTLVFKVMGKMFALTGLEQEGLQVNLKCDPERSIELRELYAEIRPGYHMNKKHWNTVDFSGSLKVSTLKELIDHSYECVVRGLSKKEKYRLDNL